MMNFGKVIKKYRMDANLSQVTLSKRLKVQSTYISAIENGKKEPSLNLLKKIAKAFHIRPEILFWEAIEITSKVKSEDRKTIELAKVLLRHYLKSN